MGVARISDRMGTCQRQQNVLVAQMPPSEVAASGVSVVVWGKRWAGASRVSEPEVFSEGG